MSDIRRAIRNDALTGSDPVLPTSYRIGEAGAAAIAASARAAADLWELRTGESQTVTVDRRHAAAAMRSAIYLRIDGNDPPESWDPFTGHYATGDGRHVFLHCNFRHHRRDPRHHRRPGYAVRQGGARQGHPWLGGAGARGRGRRGRALRHDGPHHR